MSATDSKTPTATLWADSTRAYRDEQRQGIAKSALALLTEHGGSGLSMSALAEAAGISRPTLYRYYPDLDSVLVGIAQLVAQHDEAFTALVLSDPDPAHQLRMFLDTAMDPTTHGTMTPVALEAALPPAGRDLVQSHEERACRLLADILRRGMDSGHFSNDITPDVDARLILGLAQQAQPESIERVHVLVDKLVQPTRKGKS